MNRGQFGNPGESLADEGKKANICTGVAQEVVRGRPVVAVAVLELSKAERQKDATRENTEPALHVGPQDSSKCILEGAFVLQWFFYLKS